MREAVSQWLNCHILSNLPTSQLRILQQYWQFKWYFTFHLFFLKMVFRFSKINVSKSISISSIEEEICEICDSVTPWNCSFVISKILSLTMRQWDIRIPLWLILQMRMDFNIRKYHYFFGEYEYHVHKYHFQLIELFY